MVWAPDSPDLWAPDSEGHLTLGRAVDLFLASMPQLAEWTLAADKVVTF
jgi:sulfur relay (sulfurtransferase) complex TusBCD TusD component (DsrE family)